MEVEKQQGSSDVCVILGKVSESLHISSFSLFLFPYCNFSFNILKGQVKFICSLWNKWERILGNGRDSKSNDVGLHNFVGKRSNSRVYYV